jgi:3-isopropylmalate/(R)-2-methylmalate dehydratase small subunit
VFFVFFVAKLLGALMKFTTRAVPLPNENVDTDQIIPARYLKTTSKEGLGKALFADWRYDAQGNPRPDFILNRADMAGARILLAGDNFGCGSSREHAPWALADYGFKAIVSTSFADIFRNNALKNGLLPIMVSKETHARLFHQTGEITIDLESQTLTLEDGASIHFPIDPFSKKCLLEGIDELGYLLKLEPQITLFEKSSNRGDR